MAAWGDGPRNDLHSQKQQGVGASNHIVIRDDKTQGLIAVLNGAAPRKELLASANPNAVWRPSCSDEQRSNTGRYRRSQWPCLASAP